MNALIYTDGACSGNPGPGGWAYTVKILNNKFNSSGCKKKTTNNAMELTAITKAIEYIVVYSERWGNPIENVTLRSDSAYCLNAINNKWYKSWKANNWKTKDNKDVKNKELWEKLDELLDICKEENINIIFEKVKGHNGDLENEYVDELAKSAILRLESFNFTK